jgi:hypothetical protein
VKPKLPPLPVFDGGGARVDVSDREALYNVLESGGPELPSTSWSLTVEEPRRFRLPEVVRNALRLGPGELISLQRNAISLRLDFYREVLESVPSGGGVGDWPGIEQFLRRPLTSVEPEGSVEVPVDLMALTPGDRLVLEVVREGIGHALYLYRITGRR